MSETRGHHIPPATTASLINEVRQQLTLLLETQAPRQVISAPLAWYEGWLRMLAEAMTLLHSEPTD